MVGKSEARKDLHSSACVGQTSAKFGSEDRSFCKVMSSTSAGEGSKAGIDFPLAADKDPFDGDVRTLGRFLIACENDEASATGIASVVGTEVVRLVLLKLLFCC